MQIDSTNISASYWLNSWLTPGVIVGICAILLSVYFNRKNKMKTRPTMSNVEGIYDEYGSRLLFTIISNNPAGSRCGKLFISKKTLWKFFTKKTLIQYKRSKQFLKPSRGETIPKYLIQGQETFITLMDSKLLTEDGIYKLTFYTSDGSCSNIYPQNLGSLFKKIS